MWMCVWVEARRELQVSSSGRLSYSSAPGSLLAWSSAIRLGWLAVGRGPPVLSWHWDYQCAPLYPALLHGSGLQTQILIHARWAL